jgi:uncharacterized protein HemX
MEPPRVEPPPPPAPTPAAPFDPTARPKAGGCPKPLLIGCLILFIVIGLGVVAFFIFAYKNVGKMMQISLRQSETAIMANLPPDVTPEERQRLQAAYEAARRRAAAAKSAQEIAQSAQSLNFKLLELTRKGKALTRQDVQELTRILEEFAGRGSGTPPPGSSPSRT